MSLFYCQGCQQYRDADENGIQDGTDGQYCDDCITEGNNINNPELMAKQIDGNSLEIIDMDKRVKKLEGKDE